MAFEIVGSTLLSAFFQVTFEKLGSTDVWDYFRGRKLDEKLLKRLNITLLSINAVVDDAEQKQIRNPHVKAWLDAVKDAAFEAEDLFDEIDIQVSGCKLEAESQSSTGKVWNFFNVSSVSSFDMEIESRMQQVLDNLEFLASKKDMLGLKEASGGFGVGSGRQVSNKLPSTSLPVESVIYGRKYDKKIIYNWLTSHTENGKKLSIISIVGMGGMGKTTLAQHLYNDPRMESKFDIKAWICVSEEFDVCRVTRAILVAITNSADDGTDMNMLQVKLKEKLIGKRFLLVLDDIWNENLMQWEALQIPLNYGAQGSKILVTTRSMKVASIMRSNNIHQMEQLQELHCWKLFSKHAFQDENPQMDPDFKEIGEKIIKKCKGLPLALKTIGSLLYTRSSLVEWESILESEIWDLPEEESNIIPALILSYRHLPSHLKRCFTYCALFPKDYVFEKENLILLWMAENFLQCPQQSKSMKEVGERYFNDLLLRSFFQQSRESEKHFVMHDLLNDLAKYVCGDFCFTLKEVEEAQNILKMTRHFSFLNTSHAASKRFETLFNANGLRTFLPLSMTPSGISCEPWMSSMSSELMLGLFSKFKRLRVLSLSGVSRVIELLDTIGNLKHLRYLDLSRTSLKKLPDSVCSLSKLQILKLTNCRSLVELPLNLHKLTKLCYLDFSGTKVRKMPMGVGKLKNLQVLSSFYVDKGSESNVQQLGELNLQGALSISNMHNIDDPLDAMAANLKNKVHLVKLELGWNANNDDSQKEREVLEKLQPSKHLKELSIRGYGGTRFPNWFGDNSLSNVVSLALSNCENCVMLPPLGILPSLKELWITRLSGIVVIGNEFYGNESSSSSIIPFASLETLQFEDMKGWEEWECKIVRGAFPLLQKLSIKDCLNLKEHLPEKLACLVNLKISNCEQLVASIPLAPSIHDLRLSNCGKLQFDYHPSTLKRLTIDGCCMEGSLLEQIEHTLSHNSLELLIIKDYPTMNIYIPRRGCYNFLGQLYISSSCDSLRTFPLDFFPKLRSLRLQKCNNLEMISVKHDLNLVVVHLSISDCPKFVSLPECIYHVLDINDCPQLVSFSNGGLPSNLQALHLTKCSKLLIASLKWALPTNSSLKRLFIKQVDVESFPDQGILPLSLTSMQIIKCSHLKKLDYTGLCHLSSLTELHLANCPSLQCLPEEGLPKSISTLQIWGNCSPSLKQQCKKPNGKDLGKISHIQRVMIDNEIIS